MPSRSTVLFGPRNRLVYIGAFSSVSTFPSLRFFGPLKLMYSVFVVTTEPVNEPPRLLRKYAERAGLRDDEFVTIDIGESVAV